MPPAIKSTNNSPSLLGGHNINALNITEFHNNAGPTSDVTLTYYEIGLKLNNTFPYIHLLFIMQLSFRRQSPSFILVRRCSLLTKF